MDGSMSGDLPEKVRGAGNNCLKLCQRDDSIVIVVRLFDHSVTNVLNLIRCQLVSRQSDRRLFDVVCSDEMVAIVI